jgi:hypothetical protein
MDYLFHYKWNIGSLCRLPFPDVPLFVVKTDAYLDKLLAAPFPGQQVVLAVYLRKRFLRRAVQLELKASS